MRYFKKLYLVLIIVIILFIPLAGCASGSVNLDPNNPVVITIWHHYTGIVQNSFDELVRRFNETEGMDRGIIVEAVGFGNVGDIERAVRSSAHEEIGSMELPNMFTSFPDTAYIAKTFGLLVNLDDYFTSAQLEEYFASFIERGRIGFDGELHIFPAAKSTEILMVNHTDWQPFAEATNVSYDDLLTIEGLVRVASIYYEWSGGRSFFGRDQFGNLFVIGSKQFGIDIKKVDEELVTVTIDEEVMRRIWDYYYVPHISGYFTAHGRFRSDDLRVGDILAYSGSTVSAAFFPEEVRYGGESRLIEAMVLPAPIFRDGARVMVQQGAGMVVVKSTQEEQYASSVFLRWFTQPQQNVSFSALSGHLPVKTESMDYALVREMADAEGIELTAVTDAAIRVALDGVKESLMYTPPSSFAGGVAARAVLDTHLRTKAIDDRAAVLELINDGMPRAEAIAQFNTDENFYSWLVDFTEQLRTAAGCSLCF